MSPSTATTVPPSRQFISEAFAASVVDFIGTENGNTVPPGVSKKTTHLILNAFVQKILNDVKSGVPTSITNFVTFRRDVREARDHTNPQVKNSRIHVERHYNLKVDVKPAIRKAMKAIPLEPADKK